MSLKSQQNRFCQIAVETYVVAQLHKLADDQQLLSCGSVDPQDAFAAYCDGVGITDVFAHSAHKQQVDAMLPDFFSRLVAKHPTATFQFVEVKHETRSSSDKADFTIECSTGEIYNVSLKIYLKGYAQGIQVFSGTARSFFIPYVSEHVGVGKGIHPLTGETVNWSRQTDKRNQMLIDTNMAGMIPLWDRLDEIQEYLKNTYAVATSALMRSNIAEKLAEDKAALGAEMADIACKGLTLLKPCQLKKIMLKKLGMDVDGNECLLWIGSKNPKKQGEYSCDIFDETFGELKAKLNDDNCVVAASNEKQCLHITATLDGVVILTTTIPFTINDNGAWAFAAVPYFEGTREYKTNKAGDSGMYYHGERRPGKSKEIATSFNSFLHPKKLNIQVFVAAVS